MQLSRLVHFCTYAYFLLHAYLISPFPPIFPLFKPPANHLLRFRRSYPLIQLRSPSKLACFIWLATWRRTPVASLCQRKKVSRIRLLHTNPPIGPTMTLPKQLACTVISQRPRSMAMFIVGRWKKWFNTVSCSRWQRATGWNPAISNSLHSEVPSVLGSF